MSDLHIALRELAADVSALDAELLDTRATFRAVLDYIRWDQIPADLVAEIDAIFDGNTEDEPV